MGKTRAALSFDDRADRLQRVKTRQRREAFQLRDEQRTHRAPLGADEFWATAGRHDENT
ncbi:hypothetical protein ABZ714_13165 [Streptomyces sp. NPDC006798]|uniref:hypothetical protein n=1 Tax=Streptomyces sp. NPDC006798 TaxID=3155462 RepID=UPI0033FF3E21